MKALVLGGYGAVGSHIVAQLRADGDVALAAGRDADRADRVVDLHDRAACHRAMSAVDVVVNAAGVEDPAVATIATGVGATFVDITASTDYVRELARLDPPRPVLVSVGLAPGLTNLLAADIHRSTPGPIDLVVLLGAGERHGAEATAWSRRLLGTSFRDPASGRRIRNYTEGRVFDLPGYGRRRVYRADLSDQHTLSRDFTIPVRTYLGLDSRLATAGLAALTWVPSASRVLWDLPFPGTDRWLVVARADGAERVASGQGQSHATATVAAAAARAAVHLKPGVHHLHRVMTLGDLPSDRGIHLNSGRRTPA